MWKKRTDKRSETNKQTDSTYYNYYLLAHFFQKKTEEAIM